MWFKKPADIWATATGEEASLPIIYRYRQNRPRRAKPEILPTALRVLWAFDGSKNNGMPEAADNDAQVRFEDAIEPLTEGPSSFLMLVRTGNSWKEWLFYTESAEGWAATLTKLLVGHPPYPLEISNWHDEPWSTWQQFAGGVTGGS